VKDSALPGNTPAGPATGICPTGREVLPGLPSRRTLRRIKRVGRQSTLQPNASSTTLGKPTALRGVFARDNLSCKGSVTPEGSSRVLVEYRRHRLVFVSWSCPSRWRSWPCSAPVSRTPCHQAIQGGGAYLVTRGQLRPAARPDRRRRPADRLHPDRVRLGSRRGRRADVRLAGLVPVPGCRCSLAFHPHPHVGQPSADVKEAAGMFALPTFFFIGDDWACCSRRHLPLFRRRDPPHYPPCPHTGVQVTSASS